MPATKQLNEYFAIHMMQLDKKIAYTEITPHLPMKERHMMKTFHNGQSSRGHVPQSSSARGMQLRRQQMKVALLSLPLMALLYTLCMLLLRG